SKLIADNENLAPDQKKQALADLAKKTRAQVVSALGEEAAGVYMKGSMNWLNSVEQGQLVTFSEDGQFTGSRQIPAPKKPAAVAK
ncbi:MAG: hypothetical protein ACAH89_13695, partial [Rariglobus sp.]|nr:hypothetical protein [Rariglobus sp.]